MPYEKSKCPICGKVVQSLSGYCEQHYHQAPKDTVPEDYVYNPKLVHSCESFFDTTPDMSRYMESKLSPAWAGDTLE